MIDYESSDKAGHESTYIFNFITTSTITKDSYIKIIFPKEYNFALL